MSITDEIVITENRAIAKSFAKINLTLDVLGKRENGYHDVKMIMQTVTLFDLVIVDKTDCDICVSTNLKYLPVNDKNIAYKAALAFFKHTKIDGGVKIRIQKNIPVSAGLAGGSGNAAAVLCAMNLLFDAHLSQEELIKIGLTLGADVPYCIMGGTQLSEGIGEILTPLSPVPKLYVLLVKPPISVSTALVYKEIDNAPIAFHPNTDRMISALDKGDIKTIASGLCNVMEAVTQTLHPVIAEIKRKMLLDGALGAVMSGSGPTVFGLFDDFSLVKSCADSFSLRYKEVFITRTKN
ncbi:MAG: 4-(cytidine 5'-diphospho)-2-C-methyl-D-erythritol kinase [Clostridia bacterium]|nr:4-(cytidine 5'-diphospho)-2-C-methyl-D-erythritol kinase [Clostridia bacterium]